nr:MAG TPA: intron associated endonuclease [Caudoviricetes sp.]
MYGVIYKATNLINGKVYIGQTTNSLEQRIKQHFFKKDDGAYFHNALKKYGHDGFKWEIIDQADNEDELIEKEIYWIACYESFTDKNKGYNSTSGGETGKSVSEEVRLKISMKNKGKVITEEQREKLRQAFIGREVSNETREKISKAVTGEKNGMFGKKHTEEEKENLRKLSSGRKLTQESKDKIGKAHKGKIVSQETREKLSRAKTGKKLPPFSEQHIEKLREANAGGKNPQAKPLICLDTGITYECIQEASNETGIHYKQISRCCNGDIEKAGGFKFQFLV